MVADPCSLITRFSRQYDVSNIGEVARQQTRGAAAVLGAGGQSSAQHIVDVEGYVAPHSNRYSVSVDWIGRRVEVRETKDKI